MLKEIKVLCNYSTMYSNSSKCQPKKILKRSSITGMENKKHMYLQILIVVEHSTDDLRKHYHF